MNKGYTHETKILQKTPEDEQVISMIRNSLKLKEKLGSELVGFAVVGIYQHKWQEALDFLSLGKFNHLPERLVDGAIKDLAKHCMRQFGRKAPKLIGEKDAKEIS